jgi:4-hydroxybenzoate polyprenyltransferase
MKYSCQSLVIILNSYLKLILKLIRFDKPIGTLLLLWPTLWGLWVASAGHPDRWIITVFILGVFFMRSAGCVVNDLADRNFDGFVARTQNRPLASMGCINNDNKKLGVKQAVFCAGILSSIAFILMLSLFNTKLIMHSVIALVLASVYPFCKRFFACPQFVLGLAFGYAIPMAYIAILGYTNSITWLLYSASIILTIVYDSFYAMVDITDDRKLGLYSSAIWFGQYDLIIIGCLQGLFLINLVIVNYCLNFKLYSFSYFAIFLVLLLFIYQ